MRKLQIFIGAWVILLSFEYGCNPAVDKDDLLRYMANPENGLYQIKSKQGMHFVVQYLPSSYLVLRDIQSGARYSAQQADSASRAYDQFCYYRFIIQSPTPLYKKAGSLNFDIGKDFFQIIKGDTTPCSICQPIITGNRKDKEYLLAFPKNVDTEDVNRFKYDYILMLITQSLNKKPLVFEFTQNNLSKIPRLKIKKDEINFKI